MFSKVPNQKLANTTDIAQSAKTLAKNLTMGLSKFLGAYVLLKKSGPKVLLSNNRMLEK